MNSHDLSLIHRVLPAVGEPPHPCVLLLHGRGTDESDLLPLGREIDERLFTITARAPFRFPWGGFAWYGLDPRGVGFPEGETLLQSLHSLQQFLREIVDAYPIDPSRIYVGGFSMGSVMAGTLGLTDPEHVAGAIVLSGYLPLHSGLGFHVEEASGHPFFQAHGVFDDVIPVAFGREARDYLASGPVSLTYHEYPIGHQISTDEIGHLRAWMAEVLERPYGPETAAVR